VFSTKKTCIFVSVLEDAQLFLFFLYCIETETPRSVGESWKGKEGKRERALRDGRGGRDEMMHRISSRVGQMLQFKIINISKWKETGSMIYFCQMIAKMKI
jgi:hypothetical protein